MLQTRPQNICNDLVETLRRYVNAGTISQAQACKVLLKFYEMLDEGVQ